MHKHNACKLLLVIFAVFFVYVPYAKCQDTPGSAARATPRRTLRLQLQVTSGAEKVEGATVTLESEEEGVSFKRALPRTSRDGTTSASSVPEVKLTVQVIARGFGTFGQVITLSQDNQLVQVFLTKNSPTPSP